MFSVWRRHQLRCLWQPSFFLYNMQKQLFGDWMFDTATDTWGQTRCNFNYGVYSTSTTVCTQHYSTSNTICTQHYSTLNTICIQHKILAQYRTANHVVFDRPHTQVEWKGNQTQEYQNTFQCGLTRIKWKQFWKL